MTTKPSVAGIVLAGGRAQRLGGVDKGLVPLANRSLVEWVLERIRPQVDDVVISANRNRERYAAFGCPVITDSSGGDAPEFQGPLAGILAAGNTCAADWVLTVPCDVPFLPVDLVARLLAQADAQTTLLRVADSGQIHYAIMLFRRERLTDLAAYLAEGGRKVQAWQARQVCKTVLFPASDEAFLNLNNPDDLVHAETIAASGFVRN